MLYARPHYLTQSCPLPNVLKLVMADIEQFGLDCLDDRATGDLVAFRSLELAAAIDRLRILQVLLPQCRISMVLQSEPEVFTGTRSS